MKTNSLTFNRMTGKLLVSIVIVLTLIALIYAMQEPGPMLRLSTVSWNGTVIY